jgi:hypothetical protein
MKRNALPIEKSIPMSDLRRVSPLEMKFVLLQRFPRLLGVFKDDSELPAMFEQYKYIDEQTVRDRIYSVIKPMVVSQFLTHSRPSGYDLRPNDKYFTHLNDGVMYGRREAELFRISYNLYVLEYRLLMNQRELTLPDSDVVRCSSNDETIPNLSGAVGIGYYNPLTSDHVLPPEAF